MERAGEDDDAGSGSRRRRSMGESAEATSTMAGSGTTAVKQHQALRLVEDLSLPSVQVVVMSANMGCSHCRQRVTKVVTKMNGLLDYMVDFGKKEVTVRGTVLHTKKKKRRRKKQQQCMITGLEKMSPPANVGARTLSWFLGCYGS